MAIDAEEDIQGGDRQEERWWEHGQLGTKGMGEVGHLVLVI